MTVIAIVAALVALIPAALLIPLLVSLHRAGKPMPVAAAIVGVWTLYTLTRLVTAIAWPAAASRGAWVVITFVLLIPTVISVVWQIRALKRRRRPASPERTIPIAEVNAIITFPGQPGLVSPVNGDLTVEQVRVMAARYRDEKAAVAGHDGIHVALHGERWRSVARTLGEQADALDALADRYDQPSTVAAGKE